MTDETPGVGVPALVAPVKERTREEQLADRKAAALLWLRENVTLALVVPLSVARDLLPSGIGREELGPIIHEVMPGETIDEDGVELHGLKLFVTLKRS